MKALTPLIALFVAFNLFAQETNKPLSLEDYLSTYKQKEFRLDYRKNEVESLKLRDSWVSPLQLLYRYNKSSPYGNTQITKNASVSWNQPLFRSGGIYYGIKFANASKEYSRYSIDMQKHKLTKEVIALLMQIREAKLRLKKQQKQVENGKIKLEQKRQEYLSGELDSGFLDNAIIKLNLARFGVLDIEANIETLIAKFKTLSDKDYKTLLLPILKPISKEEFLHRNIALKIYAAQKRKNDYAASVTTAKYLPSINLTASYNRDEIKNPSFAGSSMPSPKPTTYYAYGFTISIPLDWNMFRDIESSKIEMLKTDTLIADKKNEMALLYDQVKQNIQKIEKKITLAQENFKLYEKLLEDTKKLYQAGYKAKTDVELLQNSVDMAKLDMEIFAIKQQLELLKLYEYVGQR